MTQQQEFWWIGQRAMDATAVSRIYPVTNVISCDYDPNHTHYCKNHLSLEKTIKIRKDWTNSHIPEIFENEDLKRALQSLRIGDNIINIIPYASSSLLEKFFSGLGSNIHILAGTPQLKQKFDSKFFLRDVLAQVGLTVIPGEEIASETDFTYLADKYGMPFILQEEISSSGKGTKRIENKAEFLDALKSHQKKFVMKFIPDSRTYALHCCITPKGYVFSPIALQVSGDSSLSNMQFCYAGNDFSQPNNISPKLRDNIYSTVRKLAVQLRKEGWQGIFNVDILCDKDENLYIVDLNPRLTGNIQFLTDIQLIAGEEPISKHHINTFIGIEEDVPELPSHPAEGSQIILHNLEGCKVQVKKDVTPGVYKLIGGQLAFEQEGVSVLDCKAPEEFVVTSAVAQEGMVLDPDVSLLRIQSRHSYATPEGKLNDVGKAISRAVYNAFEFEKLE